MASTGKKIALGCGAGCLTLALITGGIGTCAYLGVRDVMDEAENIDVVYDDLQAKYGPPTAYIPPADGRLDPGRIALFLGVRDSLLARGEGAASAMRILDDAEGAGANPLAKIRAGMRFIPATIRYVAAHSNALDTAGMGLGEYVHLYALGYYVMLGEEPGSGPDFELKNSPGEESNAEVEFSESSEGDPRERRALRFREQLNRIGRRQLENQREEALASGTDTGWIAALDAEITRLGDDWRRLPWEDGLPEPVASSLAPYREEFAATWSPYLNALDMAALEK